MMSSRRAFIAVLAVAIAVAGILPAQFPARAQIPVYAASPSTTSAIVRAVGSITSTGAAGTVALGGQNSCAITVSGTYTGFSFTPQVSNDYPAGTGGSVHWSTAPFGSTPITPANNATATYGPAVISGAGVAAFQISVSALASGTVYYTVICSPGAPQAVGGAPSPWPTNSAGVPLIGISVTSSALPVLIANATALPVNVQNQATAGPADASAVPYVHVIGTTTVVPGNSPLPVTIGATPLPVSITAVSASSPLPVTLGSTPLPVAIPGISANSPLPVALGTSPQPVNLGSSPQPVSISASTALPVNLGSSPQPVSISASTPLPVALGATPLPVSISGATPVPTISGYPAVYVANPAATGIAITNASPIPVAFLTPQPVTISAATPIAVACSSGCSGGSGGGAPSPWPLTSGVPQVYVVNSPAPTVSGYLGVYVTNSPAPTISGYLGVYVANPAATSIAVSSVPSQAPATYYTPAALSTAAAYLAFSTSATTLTGLSVSWSGSISTASTCVVTLYDTATAPTPGTAAVAGPWVITTSAAGTFSAPIPPTLGVRFVNGLAVAITTGLTGSTACNTASNALVVSAFHL